MQSGIFRRRIVVGAAALMAGGALGAGVPSLALHNAHNSAAAAATATITLDTSQFGDLTFAKLGGIANDDPAQANCTSGSCTYTPTAAPPAITLREPYATGFATYQDMMSWEALVREGNPEGRMNATVTLTSSTGTTIAEYVLENAWPANVDVPAGGPQQIDFTVTLQGDALIVNS